MRTYCIIHDNGRSEIIRCASVFECTPSDLVGIEAAIRFALLMKRPLSLFTPLGHRETRFEAALPFQLSGVAFKKVGVKEHE